MPSDPIGIAPYTPVVGGSADTWGYLIDQAFSLIISPHDHSPGKGAQIKAASLAIDGDVPWNAYALTLAKAFTFTEVAPATMTGYSDALFVDSSTHNLFFRNNSGSNVQLTNGSQIAVQIAGGLTLDYAAVGASFGFEDSTKRYLAQSEGSPRPWSGIASADIDIYEKALIAGSPAVNKVTLKSPHALAASYAYTFPAALPAQAAPLTVDATGALKVDGVFGTNQNLQLQGTGYIKSGDRHRTILFLPTSPVVSVGSVSNNGSNFGAVVAASSTAYFPLGNVTTLERIKQVTIRLGNTPANAVSYAFYFGQAALGGVSWALIGSGTSSAANSIVMTPNGPYTGGITPNPFDTIWIQVQVPAATTCTMALADILYDVP